ncbi:MAG: N-acetylmuramoyl-L-alanine amidase [Planctomycetes bacterium]|nr:N-acetylmuramoyl-L-alanine amidase [Planctomycetota bacterium]
MKILDALLLSFAISLSFLTLYVLGSDYPAGFVAKPPIFDVDPRVPPSNQFRAIVIHGGPKACRSSAPGSKDGQAHFIVSRPNGQEAVRVEATPRWQEQFPSRHTRNREWNRHAIAIWVDSEPSARGWTAAQRAMLSELVRRLRVRYGIPAERVYLHGDIEPAVSCGRTRRASR